MRNLPGLRLRARQFHVAGIEAEAVFITILHLGKGVQQAWPALDGNSLVRGRDVTGLLRVIMDGGFTPTTAQTPQPYGMPPFRHFLNDLEIAAAATYIRNTWGNDSGGVNQREVNRVRNID